MNLMLESLKSAALAGNVGYIEHIRRLLTHKGCRKYSPALRALVQWSINNRPVQVMEMTTGLGSARAAILIDGSVRLYTRWNDASRAYQRLNNRDAVLLDRRGLLRWWWTD